MNPLPPKGTPERSAHFAEIARARWDKPRTTAKDKRVRTFPAGSKIEQRWLERAYELDLIPDGMSHQMARRLAKRLADDDTVRRVKRIHEARPTTVDEDDDLLLTHLAAEASRWRARAKRDHQIALAHELLAEQAEEELANLMFKLGLTS